MIYKLGFSILISLSAIPAANAEAVITPQNDVRTTFASASNGLNTTDNYPGCLRSTGSRLPKLEHSGGCLALSGSSGEVTKTHREKQLFDEKLHRNAETGVGEPAVE